MGTKELERFLDNKSLVALRKFAKAEAELKVLKEKHDEVIEQMKEAMIAHNVQRIDGDWGYITLAERTNYSYKGVIAKEFQKTVPDTTKIKAHHTLTGELPINVIESKTQYITKKLKDI